MQQPSDWLAYFLANKNSVRAVTWGGVGVDSEAQRRALATSLSHFQLGESGDGSRMRGLAAKYGEEYLQAVELFVKEENGHARLLAEGVAHLGGELTSKHWTETVFILLRHFLTLRVEVEVLATAEIIGLAFYEMVGERSKDEGVRAMCNIFLREEKKHLEFDADSIVFLAGCSPGFMFRLASFKVFVGAICAAWVDHGPTLRAYGYSFQDWWKRTYRLYQTFAMRRDA